MFKASVPAWQERFGWFWFNYKEIYCFSDEELEQKVKSYADMGITTLIGFTSTHFRFSFMPYKNRIHSCIRRIVEFCHKYGMRYVEHHSSALYYAPQNQKEWDFVINHIVQKGDRVEDWEGLLDNIREIPVVDGYSLSEMTQIEGSTGKFAHTPYGSYALCHNNPKYREVYFKYLEELYALGIDGIMNDEVQWFGFDDRGRNNACTCPHCRALFREMYGFELPQPENWDRFYNDYTDPAFVAWKRFKLETHSQFVRDVNRHCESLGLKLMRPNYISHILMNNLTAAPFEVCADVWDFVFQENCTFTIISASFVDYAMEAIHRNAMSADRGCPSMSMFYPYTKSSLYFTFALAKSWGQLFMQTSEDQLDSDSLEAEYRRFELDHFAFLDTPRRCADFGFLHSAMTRDYTSDRTNTKRFCAALQGAYLSGFSADLLFESAALEKMLSYKVIVCGFNAMLSDKTLETLGAYTARGGKLVIVGDFAKYDDLGRVRNPEIIHSFFENWDTLRQNGTVTELPEDAFWGETQNSVSTDRYLRGTARAESAPYVAEQMRETTGKVLSRIIGEKKLLCTAKEEILASAFDTDAGIAVHLVNITDVLAKNGETVAHYDPIKPYCEKAVPCGDVTVSIIKTREVRGAMAYTPEKQEGIPLDLQHSNGRVSMTVPAGFFAGYCLIELTTGQ